MIAFLIGLGAVLGFLAVTMALIYALPYVWRVTLVGSLVVCVGGICMFVGDAILKHHDPSWLSPAILIAFAVLIVSLFGAMAEDADA